MFISALFAIAKKWKQPKCPSVDEWIKKMQYIYTMEYYSVIRKQILPFPKHGEARPYYAQGNKPGGERQVPNDFTHLWSIEQSKT